jgi:P-type Mg2+ transporter
MNTPQNSAFWSLKQDEILKSLGTSDKGLSSPEAQNRFKTYGPNSLASREKTMMITLLFRQFTTPIVLILIGADILSFFLGDPTDAIIILVVILVSGLLGFFQEKGAYNAVTKLKQLIRSNNNVMRDGAEVSIPSEEIVPGDIVILNAGDRIPGDSYILESTNLFVGEAALTGESYPIEKNPGVVAPDAVISQRTNCLFMGTNVFSGMAKALIVHTAKETEFGKISQSLNVRPAENEFAAGIRKFGYLLAQITGILVLLIFLFNILFNYPHESGNFHKFVLETFLFALALAVGLTPQLLPAIISINLARGTRKMAEKKVIVKRLESIENFGSMNVFCSDKTGTLTEGIISLHNCIDFNGKDDARVSKYAYLNSMLETGFSNPIDESLKVLKGIADVSLFPKTGEIPYDFTRKRLSIAVIENGAQCLITKGALNKILEICSTATDGDGQQVPVNSVKEKIDALYQEYSGQGLRILGIAIKNIPAGQKITEADESGMTFLGILSFEDLLKEGIGETIKQLHGLGIKLKIITGDNHLIAANIGQKLGLDPKAMITGPQMQGMRDEALVHMVNKTVIFAEIEPNQKERILIACKKAGNVVGYMGDGINDAAALHAADVGISVNDGVDVAKDAADIVLMEKDLRVLIDGVTEGRTTFANTLKYIFMATSANFGNMFSMAGASLFLNYLPLLPKQILLTNLLTDLPEMTIATDSVDDDWIRQPRRWNLGFIKRFMVVFGLISSVFDYLTFFVLLKVLHSNMDQFRTGWFLESVISASAVVLIIRTRNSVFKSRPGKYLLMGTLVMIAVTVCLPYVPFADLFGFKRLPFIFFVAMIGMVILYAFTAEIAKKIFYRKVKM